MKRMIFLFVSIFSVVFTYAQFEEAKLKTDQFEKVKASLGADFALQYQALSQEGGLANGTEFMPLGNYINLPTANFTINGDLAPGMRVVLETYLSARHHNEAWVKGGYLLMDDYAFLGTKLNKLLSDVTVKAGVMEINYGDGHFRRTDNGAALKNAFVGNYIMDAFTTAPAFEVLYRKSNFLAMVAISTGNLKPELTGFIDNKDDVFDRNDFVTYNIAKELAFHGKFGYDKQLNDDLRVRLTVSPYFQSYSHRGTLYGGDRAGARFYSILVPVTAGATATDIKANFTNGRWGPGGTESITAVMINPFVKFKGLEFFGLYEIASGKTTKADFQYNQLAVEAIYRLGKQEQFYVGAKYNTVSNSTDESVNRIEVAGGWNITKNVLAKLEYVDQKYNVAAYSSGTGFKGVMFEAAISF